MSTTFEAPVFLKETFFEDYVIVRFSLKFGPMDLFLEVQNYARAYESTVETLVEVKFASPCCQKLITSVTRAADQLAYDCTGCWKPVELGSLPYLIWGVWEGETLKPPSTTQEGFQSTWAAWTSFYEQAPLESVLTSVDFVAAMPSTVRTCVAKYAVLPEALRKWGRGAFHG